MKPKILLSVNSKKENYINAINNCGAVAVSQYCSEDCDGYDGLLLCGGNDIDPLYYGEEMNGSVDIDKKRDASEFELVKAFVEKKKPIMGICRGLQLLNVAFGGNLCQHIENADKHGALTDDLVHNVTADSKSFLYDIYGEKFAVNSHHYQAIKKVADDFTVIAKADNDTIEAIMHKELPIFAVQWHPERMCFLEKRNDTVDGAELFNYFIEICKKYK